MHLRALHFSASLAQCFTTTCHLRGLPPAWVGVGNIDLFHDEDLAYAQRLREAGVPCELLVVQGAFHGFDALFPKRPVSQEFWRAQANALRKALF